MSLLLFVFFFKLLNITKYMLVIYILMFNKTYSFKRVLNF